VTIAVRRNLPMTVSSVFAFFVKEFKEVVPPTIFFIVGFNLIVLTTNLLMAGHGERFAGFILATTAALVVGKSVLVANHLPFFRHLDTAPLIQPVLYKSGIYFLVVFVVRLLERLVEYLLHDGSLGGFPAYLWTNFSWNRFLAIQLWILVLFLMFTFISELNAAFGHGELARIMFTWRSTDLKLTRRQRLRSLLKLSQLADAHTTEQLRDGTTAAHAEMVALLRTLTKPAA
jgi:hypothetical protein